MTKIKKWLCERYLPTYCREEMLRENANLRKRLEQSIQENQRIIAYYAGIQYALRQNKKIIIQGGERREPVERPEKQ